MVRVYHRGHTVGAGKILASKDLVHGDFIGFLQAFGPGTVDHEAALVVLCYNNFVFGHFVGADTGGDFTVAAFDVCMQCETVFVQFNHLHSKIHDLLEGALGVPRVFEFAVVSFG